MIRRIINVPEGFEPIVYRRSVEYKQADVRVAIVIAKMDDEDGGWAGYLESVDECDDSMSTIDRCDTAQQAADTGLLLAAAFADMLLSGRGAQ